MNHSLRGTRAARRTHRRERGFSLVEAIASIGVLGLVMGLISLSIFQILSIERWWKADVLAAKELRHAMSWYGRDAPNAESTTLVNGAGQVPTVVITWADADDINHSATYSFTGGQLIRTYDGAPIVVARNVTSAGFNRTGQLLRIQLSVTSSGGGIDTQALDVFARRLE